MSQKKPKGNTHLLNMRADAAEQTLLTSIWQKENIFQNGL